MKEVPAALWPWSRLSVKQKWVPGVHPVEWCKPLRRADKLITFMCRLSGNSGRLNLLEPKGLSKPVMGLVYLYLSLLLKFEDPTVHCCEMCCSPWCSATCEQQKSESE